MPTPVSSATAYCSAAAFLESYDARTVGDLCSMNGTRVSASALLSDPVLARALLGASGMIEAACLVAGRYAPADLQALTGASRAFLERLAADLALGLLIRGRPDRKLPVPPQFNEVVRAGGWLDQLRGGERIFGLQETQDAGQISADRETQSVVEARRLVTQRARRFFGSRTRDYPA